MHIRLSATALRDRRGADTDDAAQKPWRMIKDIRYAMLTSEDGDLLRGRPMAASRSAFDGTLWFFTRADSHGADRAVTSGRPSEGPAVLR